MAGLSQAPVVVSLGLTQTLAWASSYYLPAVLAAPMANELKVLEPTVFGAFSAALLVSAVVGPFAGRAIDQWGGRQVLPASNLVFAFGLIALGSAQGPVGLFAAWALLGVGMGCGLYEAAFASLVRLYGAGARNAITGITLFAGFASTVGWPLTLLLEAQLGWRGACFVWAALHLMLGLPFNRRLPSSPMKQTEAAAAVAAGQNGPRASKTAAVLLAFVFAVTWFISTAMAAHLPALLMLGGAGIAAAVALAALVGPAQVAGRLLEFGLLRRVHPLLSARVAALLHPVGGVLLASIGSPASAAFAILHGAGNGVLTIAKGTLPLVLFGTQGYGERQGLLMVPARLAQALAPWLFGLCLQRWGLGALWLSTLLGLLAFGALMALPKNSAQWPDPFPDSSPN